MRHSLLVTCLLLTAWIDPAGNVIEANSVTPAAGVSMVEKATDGSAVERDAVAGPVETTKQLIDFDDVAIVPISKVELPVKAEWPLRPSVDALAALDAVADGLALTATQPVPLPPHRAIPHTEVCEALASAAQTNEVPTPFFIRLIWQESNFRQNIVSPAGAQGVAQFMPTTAAENGLDDPFNPLQAVRASARLLRDLIKQFGNVGLAAAAYNAGPRRVQDWLDKRGKLPQETQDYVEHITGKKAEQWKAKTASAAPLRVPERAPCQREAGLYAANGPTQIPLPPVLAKDEPAKMTKTASAKSNAKPARDPDKDRSRITTASAKASKPATKGSGKTAGKDQSRIASTDKAPKGAPKAAAKVASKTGSKGKKVKVADAEARK